MNETPRTGECWLDVPGQLFETPSPGLVLSADRIRTNIDEAIRLAGGAERIRPHFKTHKTGEIARLWIERGVTRHKCATLAEAEVLAAAGAADVLIAYQLAGPNLAGFIALQDRFPGCRFASLVDCATAAEALASASRAAGRSAAVSLDLNSGMNRTGIMPGPEATELYELMATTPGLTAAGLHWYDGHLHQPDESDRRQAVLANWQRCLRFRDQLLLSGFEVPAVVAGGSGSFAFLADTDEPGLEVSPGTVSLWDARYWRDFLELPFLPAAAVLTRVVSHPGSGLLTLDAGHKALAGDLPLTERATFPALPDARIVGQSEEHLVIATAQAPRWPFGSPLFAIPGHICPTVALHETATIVEDGCLAAKWSIAARHRSVGILPETPAARLE